MAAEFSALCTTWASGSQLEEEGKEEGVVTCSQPRVGKAGEDAAYLAHSGWLDTVSLMRLLVTLMM